MRYILCCLITLGTFTSHTYLGFADTPAASPAPTAVKTAPLDITDLKIQMAESGLAVGPSLTKIADLSNALEAYLNRYCFGELLTTLSYEGPPTDPQCIARMERLFEIYPDNPVALCLRDGITAQSCRNAYQRQKWEKFSDNSSNGKLLDPSLKVGLSARDQEKVKALRETLQNVNKDYQKATSDEDKQQNLDDALQLYDQLLSITCKLTTISLEESVAEKVRKYEDPAIIEARKKLLQIPPDLRADYQKKMIEQTELEIARNKTDKYRVAMLLEKISAIQNPERDETVSAKDAVRKRIVLPACYETIQQAGSIIPQFPSPTCHRIGWNSPQCLEGIKQWRVYRLEVRKAALARKLKNATPTPNNVISSF